MKKNISYFLILFMFAFISMVPSLFGAKNIASAEDLVFQLDTNGYVSGTWVNEDVVIDLDYNGIDEVVYEYSYELAQNYVEFSQSVTFTSEGSFDVFFRIRSLAATSEAQQINIKIDKTNPSITLVYSNQTLPTNQNITLTVLPEDNLSGVIFYKFKDNAWQSLNSFVVTQNTSFEIGDIKVRDRAGNITEYDREINIENIFKSTPIINLDVNIDDISASKVIIVNLRQVEPEIESLIVTTPSGEQIDITNTYQNSFVATQYGTYIFTVTTVAGQTTSASILLKNIVSVSAWQAILIYSSLCAVGIIFLINAINLTTKRLKKNKINK